METFIKTVSGRKLLWLGFLWGIAEGTLFFIVPDVIITLVALFAFRRSLEQVGAVVLGSLLAGFCFYLLAQQDYAFMRELVASVPLVKTSMFATVVAQYQEHGVWGLLYGPTSGIPYKIYAIEAPAFVSFGAFLLATIPARLERLLLSWIQFALIGAALKKWAPSLRSYRLATAGFLIYWVVVYILYVKAV